MREARADELLYDLFATTRGWTRALRGGLVSDDPRRRTMFVSIAGEIVADKMRHYFIFPQGEPAPLNQAELALVFARVIGDWPATLCASLVSPRDEGREDARWHAARLLAAGLVSYQVVVDGTEPPPMRTALAMLTSKLVTDPDAAAPAVAT